MSLIRKHGAVLQAWACLAFVFSLRARLNCGILPVSFPVQIIYRIVSCRYVSHSEHEKINRIDL